MNKTIIWVLGAVLVIIIGAIVFFSNGDKDDAMMKNDESVMMDDKSNDTMIDGDDSMMDDDAMMDDTSMMSTGSYEVYAPEKLAKAKDGNIVLYFRASWCPLCKVLDADIRAHLKDIPANLTILDVDYDNSTELKKKYGVTYQHTLVQVDAEGNMITKWSGSSSLATLAKEVK